MKHQMLDIEAELSCALALAASFPDRRGEGTGSTSSAPKPRCSISPRSWKTQKSRNRRKTERSEQDAAAVSATPPQRSRRIKTQCPLDILERMSTTEYSHLRQRLPIFRGPQ